MDLLHELRDQIVSSGKYTAANHYEKCLAGFQSQKQETLVLRLIWDCGMSIEEICSLRGRNIGRYDMTIKIIPEGFVPTRACRTIFVKDGNIFDLIDKSVGSVGSRAVIAPDSEDQAFQNPADYMEILTQKIWENFGLKTDQISLLRGKFVDMVDNGTKDLYDIIRFFGSENLSKMKIMNNKSAESEGIEDGDR